MPSDGLVTAVRSSRQHTSWRETSDPERALRNIIDRDLLLSRHVQRQADELGLSVLHVDTDMSLEEIEAIVEEHFAPLLSEGGGL